MQFDSFILLILVILLYYYHYYYYYYYYYYYLAEKKIGAVYSNLMLTICVYFSFHFTFFFQDQAL